VLATVLLTVGVAACETEAVGGPDEVAPGSLTATINGTPWRANAPVGYGSDVGQTSPTGAQVLVVGGEVSNTGGPARLILLRLNDFTGPGTYALGTRAANQLTGPSFAVLQLSVGPQPIAAYETVSGPTAGTVTVTTWDAQTRRIAGTFAFSARASTPDSVVSIADGQFEGRLGVSQ
jgi:hypothetical protein